jgi:hypothetical protein
VSKAAATATVAAALLLCAAAAAADETAPHIDMQGTSIIGDRELPNVLYIVPWKDAVPATVSPQPHARRDDLMPGRLERDAVQRQLRRQQHQAEAGSR